MTRPQNTPASAHFLALKEAVAKDAAIRLRTFLASDGSGYERPDGTLESSIVSPATYAKEKGRAGTQGPIINVLADGDVLELRTALDSVGSQANRFESALDSYVATHEDLPFPYLEIVVAAPDTGEATTISCLAPPHRGADAYFRSTEAAEYIGDIFKMRLGQVSYEEDVTLALQRFPTNLLFGAWDSNRNALARTARAIRSHIDGVSRITVAAYEKHGVDAIKVYAKAQRRDPLIGGSATLYQAENDGGWTLDADAETVKKAKEAQKKLKPGETNPYSLAKYGLGDIPADKTLAGVRIDYAVQHAIISLATLRGLRFPLGGVVTVERDLAGQTYLAALGLLAYELAVERGYFLRSGCSLVSTKVVREILGAASGTQALPWDDSAKSRVDVALELYREAVQELARQGIELEPRRRTNALPELARLLANNAKIFQGAEDEDEGAA